MQEISVVVSFSAVTHQCLIHLPDELVDVVFPVTQIAALHKVAELPSPETTRGVAELEGPQKVGNLLEVGAVTRLVPSIQYQSLHY
jgi:hypothetical protein